MVPQGPPGFSPHSCLPLWLLGQGSPPASLKPSLDCVSGPHLQKPQSSLVLSEQHPLSAYLPMPILSKRNTPPLPHPVPKAAFSREPCGLGEGQVLAGDTRGSWL